MAGQQANQICAIVPKKILLRILFTLFKDVATQSPTSSPNQAVTTDTPTNSTQSLTSVPSTITIPTESEIESPSFAVGTIDSPASSCNDIPLDSPSGEYWIQTNSSTSPVQIYCDTYQRNCSCNSTGGWARVANLDMTDPTQQCPVGFKQITRTESPLRTCGRPDGHRRGCVSTIFPVHGIKYSRVCGRIVGYQVGPPGAFRTAIDEQFGQNSTDGYYLEGISITHSQPPRHHIWSFAGAVGEQYNHLMRICPCTRIGTSGIEVPSFVGDDYFCDTANRGRSLSGGFFYANDPLWDGQGCGSTSTCCEFNNPPWFCKQLSQPTTDNIELRICNDNSPVWDDSPFEIIEMYIN